MTTPLTYAEANFSRFVDELVDLIKIKSISSIAEHKGDVRKAAEWVLAHLQKLGVQRAQLFETSGHPIVYGEWLGAGDAPTVLVYGHYDVQPALKEDGWKTADPFIPETIDGNLIARGATDDKGQFFIHLKTFESMMQATGSFPLNIKFLIEGEEEVSSTNLEKFIESHKDLLKADVAIISDTSMFAPGVPAICYGLRGYTLLQVEVTGPKDDLHSGTYGGSVHNPIQALVELLNTMHDADGYVTLPGFYDDVRILSDDERAVLAEIPYTEDVWRSETGAPQPWGELEFTIYERTSVRPTLELISIDGGEIKGIKNIVPKSARAKISCRLVPYQKPEHVAEVVKRYIEAHTPPTVKIEVKPLAAGSPAVLVNRDSEAMQVAIDAYEQVFGKKPLFILGGGSIPVVTDFQERLGLPTILMGFGLPDDNLHAPNEKMALEQIRLGIQTMVTFYSMLPERLA